MSGPAPGQMILYDDLTPPLEDNSYRLTVATNVTIDGAPQPLDSKQSFFNIEGPRFRLQPSDIASLVPPRNARGPFAEVVPHVALYRKTLPWERELNLDPNHPLPTPKTNADLPALPKDGLPWLALLLLEENEYTLLQNQPLEQVLPKATLNLMGNPQGVTCDAIQVDSNLLQAIMPSLEELQLLCHLRQVNVADKELNVGSTDGFFSVIMSNRLPTPNAKCRACLVSLEGRPDLVPVEPPAQTPGFNTVLNAGSTVFLLPAVGAAGAISPTSRSPGILKSEIIFRSYTTLVLLYSWQYEVVGDSNFEGLMQNLNVGMIGTVADPGHPALTDTAHLKMEVADRSGATEQVWYRGPLVPFQLTRDPLGPYHSADQCRRATPETGVEDVSYAAAFEVGRLLAAADPRLAQELMRWRREAFKISAKTDSVSKVQTALSIASPVDVHAPVAPVLGAGAATQSVLGAGPVGDPYLLNKVGHVVGLNAAAVQTAYGLASAQEAAALLGGDPAALGANVAAPAQTARPNTTLAAVAADTASLNRLNQARARVISNVTVKIGAPGGTIG